jgi:hypothetical protein
MQSCKQIGTSIMEIMGIVSYCHGDFCDLMNIYGVVDGLIGRWIIHVTVHGVLGLKIMSSD